ncbi:hypothetical protein BGP75_05140 [Motiliproteus sp. MSK22-1]|nr:hypothetical protein BGP75_05140 [Motiliproteus sp. MSK22-1]
MIKATCTIISFAVPAYVALCGFLYLIQDSLIYFPQPRALSSPQNTLILPVQSEEIVISTRPHSGSKAILYFGGNSEDVSQNLPVFDKVFPNQAVYLMHYRGYGGSSGTPSEAANYSDAVALFKTVQKDHSSISIIGRSLGTGIATRLASQFPATNLVLVTPYDSIEAIASNKFPYIPVGLLLRDKYNSGKYAPDIKIPTTILMAEHDQVIPRQSTEMLSSRFSRNVVSLILFEGVGHNSISADPRYLPALQNALKR